MAEKMKYEVGKVYNGTLIMDVRGDACSVKQLSKNLLIRKIQLAFYLKKIKNGNYNRLERKNPMPIIGKEPTIVVTLQVDSDFIKTLECFIAENNAGIILSKKSY